jgi:hypothetical protein
MRVRVAFVVMLIALSTRANADPPEPRDEGTATLLSVLGTAGPLVMLAATAALVEKDGLERSSATLGVLSIASLYALPSAGHWYSSKAWTRGFAIRTAGVVIGGLALVAVIKNADCHCFCDDGDSNVYLMGFGGAIVVGGAVYDIATASSRARAVNARMQPTITPVPMPGGGGVSVSLVF